MKELSFTIEFLRSIGVNIPAIAGAIIATFILITTIQIVFKNKPIVIELLDRFKPVIPCIPAVFICMLFEHTNAAHFLSESLMSAAAAAYFYKIVKTTVLKG